jgi:hypothetical protein
MLYCAKLSLFIVMKGCNNNERLEQVEQHQSREANSGWSGDWRDTWVFAPCGQ